MHLQVQEMVRRRRELARLITGRTPRRRINARLPQQLQPDTLRLRYFGDLRHLLVRARDLVQARIGHRLRAIADEVRLSRARGDASVRDVPGLISAVEDEYWDGFSAASAESLAEKYARATSDFQREQLGRQLSAATGVPVPIRDGGLGRAVDRFTTRNVSLITSIPERYFTSIRNTLVEDVGAGARWEEIADDLEERFQVSESTAKLVARDQVGKLYGALNQERQEELGIPGFIWRTMRDNRVREEHVLLDGNRYEWDSPPSEGVPGEPINCVPEGASLSLHAPALVAYRRRYSGELAELVVDDGEPLRVTPNHPVLTQRGWLPAHLVQVADYLFEAPTQGVQASVADPQRGYAKAEEVFRAAATLGISHRVAGGAARFHGDATDQEIDVVDVEGGLLFHLVAALAQGGSQHRLAGTAEAALRLGYPPPLFVGLLAAADRLVRSFGEAVPLFGWGAAHPLAHGLATSARRHAGRHQVPVHHSARDAELLRQRLDALAAGVATGQLSARQLQHVVGAPAFTNSAGPHAGLAQVHADDIGAAPEALAHLRQRCPGEVCPRRVLHRRLVQFSGHVFNLETETGWFGSAGLIVKNCRCYAEPDIAGVLQALAA